jgi:hypothetical protein
MPYIIIYYLIKDYCSYRFARPNYAVYFGNAYGYIGINAISFRTTTLSLATWIYVYSDTATASGQASIFQANEYGYNKLAWEIYQGAHRWNVWIQSSATRYYVASPYSLVGKCKLKNVRLLAV